jgi:hypothetical protein
VDDVAAVIFEISSRLVRTRDAARRRDHHTLRVEIGTLGDLSAHAGAHRMAALCGYLLDRLIADARPDGSVPSMEIDALIDAVADEFERLPGDLQGSYHACAGADIRVGSVPPSSLMNLGPIERLRMRSRNPAVRGLRRPAHSHTGGA